MSKITAVFSDVGGVLASNGWDRYARHRLVGQYRLDWDEYEDRHELVATAFETGHITLEQYLDRTIFYRARDFSRDQIRQFMFDQSQPRQDSLEIMARLARAGRCFLATLNNESRELNLHRIQRFGLKKYFAVFFSSCFLGVKKPDEEIYAKTLAISQRAPEECVFIDDRELNLEVPKRLGMKTIQFQNAAQLETELKALGLEF
jgi:putative hydrolase of the HAD superfamily